MKNAKKIAMLLFSLILLIGIFSFTALADEATSGATVVYPDGSTETVAVGQVSVNENSVLKFSGGMSVVDGSGNITTVYDIPYVITGTGVTEPLSEVSFESTCSTSVTSTGSTFVFKGSGSGHNIGMSQWGANSMARQGFTYKDILNFYYSGTMLG